MSSEDNEISPFDTMSNNSLQIAGNASYWGGGAGATLVGASGLTFTIQQFNNYPKIARLTISGPCSLTVSAAGNTGVSLTLPGALIPAWAKPRGLGAGFGGSVFFGTQTQGLVAVLSPSGDDGIFVEFRGNLVASAASATGPFQTTIQYFVK